MDQGTNQRIQFPPGADGDQVRRFCDLAADCVSRASLPPIIFLGMYRSTPVANEIGSLGYIVAIIASLQFAMQPRSKYLHSLIQNIIFTCAAVPYSILGLYCARVARHHTQAPRDRNPYNSSAAAVSAIFLFVNVYAINVFRAVYPPFCIN